MAEQKDIVAKAKAEAEALKNTQKTEADDIVAKAKAEAEALKNTQKTEADDIVAKAKAEAEAIISAAKSEAANAAADVAFKGVSKKSVLDDYNDGLNHMQLAQKHFGSMSEENVRKIHSIVDAKHGLTSDVPDNVEVY